MKHGSYIALFDSFNDADKAVGELSNIIDGSSIGVIATEESTVSKKIETSGNDENVAEGAETGAATGAAVGGLAGLLAGITAITIPGFGPIITLGSIAAALGTTAIGAGVGAIGGGLVGALIGYGIPEEEAQSLAERVKEGAVLLSIDYTSNQKDEIHDILEGAGAERIIDYDDSEGVADNATHDFKTR